MAKSKVVPDPKKDEIWMANNGGGRVVIQAVQGRKIFYHYLDARRGREASMDGVIFKEYFSRQAEGK